MFVEAIEKAAAFTRPIHSIRRYYGSKVVIPGAATLFFVNEEGWALTCKHVAGTLMAADKLNASYKAFKNEMRRGQNRKGLERKYGYSKKSVKPVEILNMFVNCVEGMSRCEIQVHPTFDVALIRFDGFQKLLCDAFPVFPADTSALKQGKFLCRLGFPFAEFENFRYDETADSIIWTNKGRPLTPRFPIEGMVTRHLGNNGGVFGFELSTPGLRGQSGGPAFDADGRVWGMQFGTTHLDLDFDVDMEVFRNGRKKPVRESAFLHVGRCIHVDVLKEFMSEHKVRFRVDQVIAHRPRPSQTPNRRRQAAVGVVEGKSNQQP